MRILKIPHTGYFQSAGRAPRGLWDFSCGIDLRLSSHAAQSPPDHLQTAPTALLQPRWSVLPYVSDKTGDSLPSSPPSRSLQSATFVCVRANAATVAVFSPGCLGPYHVRVPSNKYYVTDIGGRPQAFSKGNIKPHLEASPIFPVPAPRRGPLPTL